MHRYSFVLLLLVTLTGLTGCTGSDPEAPAQPAIEPLPAQSNILLITVDTLRADHLSSYGYVRQTSPVIDRLAAEGVRFDQAQVQWPKTTPSFASMFTSTYARDNQIVRTAGQPVSCKFAMLAEVLKRQGYATGAVVANAAVGSDFYFDQGFDEFIETWKLHESGQGVDPNRAEAVTNLAIRQLDRLKATGKPYFLWVHYLDPHAPYEPPGPHRDRFQNDEHFDPTFRIPLSDKPKQQMFGIGSERVLDGRDELAFYVARYDAEIAYTDEQIGRLLGEVKQRGMDQKTLTAFTSDHGESLGEHGYYFDHGRFSFQTCLRVPLILHYPGAIKPRVDQGPVELIHLSPTLLEAAGVKLDGGAWMQGRSLTPRLRGEKEPERPAPAAGENGNGQQQAAAAVSTPGLSFSEAGWETNNKWQKVVRDGRFKLIYAQTRPEQRWIGGEGVRFTLFDLVNDPGETRNVADQHPQETERLTKELWKWDRAPRFQVEVDTEGGTCGDQRGVSKETEDLLRSLGYL
jgi:arylsulfatase A-like enzyme